MLGVTAWVVYSRFGGRRKEAASKGDTCGRHAGSAGVGVGREGLLLAAAGVTGDWLRCSLWGSHSRQHLLGPHQHPLTPVWQFHSCGGTAAADGFVPASTAVVAKLRPCGCHIGLLSFSFHLAEHKIATYDQFKNRSSQICIALFAFRLQLG